MGGCISTLCCGESADAGAAKAEDEQKLEIGVGVTQNGEAGFEIDPIRPRKKKLIILTVRAYLKASPYLANK